MLLAEVWVEVFDELRANFTYSLRTARVRSNYPPVPSSGAVKFGTMCDWKYFAVGFYVIGENSVGLTGCMQISDAANPTWQR